MSLCLSIRRAEGSLALNKRKILDAARKFAQKGAKAKALKEYNKLLTADARDAKLLLEVGDAYRRWGQAEEAIAQYSKVAQQYRQDGFDARAVAVFKQILNLDPKHYSAYVALAELYQRMGLDAEAVSSLQTAADGYHKEGRKNEALELLRQMAALDPTNTTSRLKVAELLRQEDMTEEALAEYEAVAGELESQQAPEQVISVFERILEIDPDRLSTLNSLVQQLMATGSLDRAEPLAIHALSVSEEPPQYEILMALYAQVGDDAKLADTTRAFAKLYRERGDDENARSLMQRLPNEDVAGQSSSRLAVDVSEVAEPDLRDDDLLEDEPFLTLGEEAADTDFGPSFDSEDELSLETPIEPPAAAAASAPSPAPTSAGTASNEPVPEGDPDQLLAEASVYLRYGKRDQAIASLQAVLAQDQTHRSALEKLGEAYAEGGMNEEAVAAWCRAAEQVQLANDQDALAVLKDRIAALDPQAAAKIAGPTASAAAADMGDDGIGEDITETSAPPSEFEFDLDLDDGLEESSPLVAPGNDDLALDDDDEFEIELDDDSVTFDSPPAVAKPAAEKPQFTLEQTEPDLADAQSEDGEFQFELDGDDVGAAAPDAEEFNLDLNEDVSVELDLSEDAAPQVDDDPGAFSTTTTAKINEEIEEAEFYIGQDMFAEATEILNRVLELVPNHPSAMLRMGEIAAAQGEEPDQAGVDQGPDAKAAAARNFESTARYGEGDDLIDAGATQSGLSLDLDLDFDDDEEDEDELEAIEVDDPIDPMDLSVPATEPFIEPAVEPEPVEEAAAEPEAAAAFAEPEPEPETGTVDAEETFDLREALADVLGDSEDDSSGNEGSGVLSTVTDGFESIFSDFKKGVTATLDEGDFDTRYDLGIAYREMGLYEDAIGEFRVCLDSDTRRFDSLYLMGLCARDLQRFADAVNHLEQALAMPNLPIERMAGVYFDLSIAHEAAGDSERACSNVRRVIEIETGFPGAAERLAALEAGTTTPKLASESDDGFESFDDLFEEDEADAAGDAALAEAVPVETFESFDDVVSEAEADYIEGEMIEGEAILEAEPLSE